MSALPTLDLLHIMAAGHLSGISIPDTVWFQDGEVMGLFSYHDGERTVQYDPSWPPAQEIYNDSSIESQRKFVYDLFAPGEVESDIVAVLILPTPNFGEESEEAAAAPRRVAVDYLSVERLNHFLSSGSFDGDCLLGKFVVPRQHHSLVYCVYGDDKLLGVEHRINRNKIHDRQLSVYERTCTSAADARLNHAVELSTGSLGRLAKIVEKLANGVRSMGCDLDRMSFYLSVTPPVAGGVVGRYVLLCASEAPLAPQYGHSSAHRDSVVLPTLGDEDISWGAQEDTTVQQQPPHDHTNHTTAPPLVPSPTGTTRVPSASQRRAHRRRPNSVQGLMPQNGRCTRPLTPQEIRQGLARSSTPTATSTQLRSLEPPMTSAQLFRPNLNKSTKAQKTRPAWNSTIVVRGPATQKSPLRSRSPTNEPSSISYTASLTGLTPRREAKANYSSSSREIATISEQMPALRQPLEVRQPIGMYVHDLQDACLMGYMTRPHHIPQHLLGAHLAVPKAVESMGDAERGHKQVPNVYDGKYSMCESTQLLKGVYKKNRVNSAGLSRLDYDGVAANDTLKNMEMQRFNPMGKAADVHALQGFFRKRWLDRLIEADMPPDSMDDHETEMGDLTSADELFATYRSLTSASGSPTGSPRNRRPGSPMTSPQSDRVGERLLSAEYLDGLDRSPKQVIEEYKQRRETLAADQSQRKSNAKRTTEQEESPAEQLSTSPAQTLSPQHKTTSTRQRRPSFNAQSPSSKSNRHSRVGSSVQQIVPVGTGTPRRKWIKRHFDAQFLLDKILDSFYDVYSAALVSHRRAKMHEGKKQVPVIPVIIEELSRAEARECVAWLKSTGIDCEVQDSVGDYMQVEMHVREDYSALSSLKARLERDASRIDDLLVKLNKAQLDTLGETLEERCYCTKLGTSSSTNASVAPSPRNATATSSPTNADTEEPSQQPRERVSVFEGLKTELERRKQAQAQRPTTVDPSLVVEAMASSLPLPSSTSSRSYASPQHSRHPSNAAVSPSKLKSNSPQSMRRHKSLNR